jgi:type II secretory pathway predicted ATPase ExeA
MPPRAKRPCRHKGVRQSPTMSADIVTNTDSSMLVMAGATTRQERAGRIEGTVGPGKSYGRVSYSVINTCVRIIAGRR